MAFHLTRRTFIKGSGAAVGAAAVTKVLAPSETLTKLADAAPRVAKLDVVPTTCWIGKQDCGILAHRVGGRVVKLEGHPDDPRNVGTLCPKGQAQIMALYDPNRVQAPLVRTNPKGRPGKWRKASWDEALDLVAEKVKEVRERDKRLLIWQKGRSKAKSFYDDAFVTASGAEKLHHGAFCSDAGYRACEYTVGQKAVLAPDFRDTKYLLSWGWNITNAGGNQTCWITWPRQMLQARERGLKVVVIDPRLRGAGPFADEWLPIKPSTDLALALALAHELVANGTIDRDYLAKHTNAGYLVGADGRFVTVDSKPQVWSGAAAVAADTSGVTPALEGSFEVAGAPVRPAFEVLKEHLEPYTPKRAAKICGLDAADIRRIAADFGREALIGSTMIVDGVEVPHRPVAIMAYHVSQQELGFQAIRGMLLAPMLVGAIGAAGGQRFDIGAWKVDESFKKLDEIKIKDPPYNIYLKDSKYFPINSNNSSLAAHVMADPERYGVDYTPEVMILHMTNPLGSFVDTPVLEKAYAKFKFIAAIDPWLSRTADRYADVVLPAATMEKYEGPIKASDQYIDATSLRTPAMDPMFDSRGDIDIYLDLCEKVGILTGKGGYLDTLNTSLKLKDPYKVPIDAKPTTREIFDLWAKSEGVPEGVAYFEEHGIKVKGPIPPKDFYGYAMSPAFGGIKHRLYGESLLRYQSDMKKKDVDEIYWRDYTALPTWRDLTMDGSPKDYDLYLISFKLVEHKQSRSSMIPLLAELAREAWIEINPHTAKRRGIEDGDEVVVESHNAVTGERRHLKVKARLRESIRPDVVAMPHHFGEVARSRWTKDQGPTPNSLFFTGEGYVANTADQTFQVKVRVTKA